MKRIFSILLALLMTFSLSIPAFATDTTDETLTPTSTNVTLNPMQVRPANEEIEIYVTRISEESLNTEYHSAKEEKIDFQRLHTDITSGKNSPEALFVATLDYSELAEAADPIMQRAFALLNTTRAKGFNVHSVNIILPYNESKNTGNTNVSSSVKSSTIDPDDLAYWLEETDYWGTYQNQDIRYTFFSYSISKPKANVESRPSTWPNILSKLVKVAVDRWIGTTKYDTVYNTICDIQAVLGAATPVNYTFDSSTEWIKSETVGTLTYKDVYLEDINDKIPGYAYYIWGTLQQLEFQTRVEVKYYAGTVNGAPSYPTVTSPYSAIKTVRSRYFNSTSVFPILREYYNYIGYTAYDESVDLKSAGF